MDIHTYTHIPTPMMFVSPINKRGLHDDCRSMKRIVIGFSFNPMIY